VHGKQGGYTAGMIRRIALLAPFAALVLALPLAAKEVPLDVLSAYLNGLSSFQSNFVQVNADGSKSKGVLYVKRPGRARFEYAPPNKNLVIVAGGQVVIFDPKSKEPPEQYPLSRTPLNLILAQNIDLAAAKGVVGHQEVGKATIVRWQDAKHPEYGTIDLVFSDNPIALTKWIITDDIGNQTSVSLGALQGGQSLSSNLFSMELELSKRGQ
jgi:outer membrane lipoprotein-sorting protein